MSKEEREDFFERWYRDFGVAFVRNGNGGLALAEAAYCAGAEKAMQPKHQQSLNLENRAG